MFIKACSNLVHNTTMRKMLYEKMEQIGSPVPTEEEVERARIFTEKAMMEFPAADPSDPIAWKLMPYTEEEPASGSSTDVGDVSWVCPTAQIQTATVARGTAPHSWQWVAQSKDPLAHKMTRYGAKVMAAGVVELMTDADLLAQAQEEFRRRVGPDGYEPPIPKGVVPQSMNSLHK